jgi:cobalt-precorrin 5A hydrolase
MSPLLAIGVGFRKDCSGSTLAQLVTRTLDAWPRDLPRPPQRCLFTVEDKRGDAAIHEAARSLGAELIFLSREALQDAMPRTQTRSERVQALFGLESVAEAAALAGGGPNASLIVPRQSGHGVTCALAAEIPPLPDHAP